MSNKAKSLDELKDSQILFDKDLPFFGYMIISIFALLMAGALLWSMHAKKVYMIRAQGIVTSSESNYVMSSYTGEIKESYMNEGKLVSEGEVLFVVKSTEFDLQQEQLQSTKQNYEKQVQQYERLVKSIKDDCNYFDAGSSDDSLYYNTYENYKAQLAQCEVDTAMYKAYGYTDEQIQNELIKGQAKKSELYYAAIQSAENAKKELENQLLDVISQLSALGNGKLEYEIKATSTGVLHLLSDYKKGMVVQTATPVATITPEQSDTIIEAYVSTADMARMHVEDPVQIEVNGLSQTIYGNIKGTVQQIDSNLTTMESGENGNAQMFKVRILPKTNYLISKYGEKTNLTNGMTVEARVAYDKLSYFEYLLEKMGVKYK